MSVLQLRSQAVLGQRGLSLAEASKEEAVDRMTNRMVENMRDPEATHLRAAMEAAGIEHAVIVGLDWGLVAGPLDDDLLLAWLSWAETVVHRHDGFFRFLLGIDPRRPEAEEVAYEALRADFVSGIKLYPPAGFAANDPRCDGIYSIASDAGAVVMCHTGRQTYPFDMAFGRVEQYASVQRKHPGLRLILGHAGAPFWGDEAVEVCMGHPGTYLEISGWNHLLHQEPDRVRRLLTSMWNKVGPHRVLFGSDYLSGPGFDANSSSVVEWKEFVEKTAVDSGIDLTASQRSAFELFQFGAQSLA